MIYQPPKYHHSNSFTHFLQLHSSISNSGVGSGGGNNNNSNSNSNRERMGDDSLSNERTKLEIHDQNSNTSNATTEIDVANESVGKSFTIAAILGLKKNSVHPLGLQSRQSCDLDENCSSMNDYNSDFPSIINLTTHSKIFQKFDNNDNRHNYMLSQPTEHSTQIPIPIEQCIYDNNTTSNSSYQEHLHKQHINSEFSINYNRNVDELSINPQANSVVLRNQIHPNSSNILNKAFNRDRNRVDHFTNKNKSSSISLKNKRVRTIFTPEQLERLEAEFERQQYMVGPERLYLAHTLQLTEAQVKVWFQNRRIKSRKQHFEMTQHHLAIARQRQQQQQSLPPSKEESTNSDEQIVSDVDD
ncbi:hypothetical protein PVAND_009611 [Polypedilum vanderplanki]|uniref:Homeobox domain-containing protein n=1 Tax=Polypedilum vanderplanki TaxID=319348 RepID=A0A9J6CDA4_POLVA|nr:hypothetical protein PVAND_009611 [Polypedilum vanderplanki]